MNEQAEEFILEGVVESQADDVSNVSILSVRSIISTSDRVSSNQVHGDFSDSCFLCTLPLNNEYEIQMPCCLRAYLHFSCLKASVSMRAIRKNCPSCQRPYGDGVYELIDSHEKKYAQWLKEKEKSLAIASEIASTPSSNINSSVSLEL